MSECYKIGGPCIGLCMGPGGNLDCDKLRKYDTPKPTADKLAKALFRLLDTKEELHIARRGVPSYTGPNSDLDYYRDEQALYNKAVQEYEEAVLTSLKENDSCE